MCTLLSKINTGAYFSSLVSAQRDKLFFLLENGDWLNSTTQGWMKSAMQAQLYSGVQGWLEGILYPRIFKLGKSKKNSKYLEKKNI